jgi:hypothetical protein
VNKTGWLPKYRFFLINGNIDGNIRELCDIFSENCLKSLRPGDTVVIDESVWEYLGDSPCHAFIPRKPHPNGLLIYVLAGYTAKMRIPIIIAVEPWIPFNKLTPRDSAKALMARLHKAYGQETDFHLVADSAFGSYSDAEDYAKKRIWVTFSMAETPKQWLYELLLHEAVVDSGRVALLPMASSNNVILASCFRVKTEKDKIIDIKTISTAYDVEITAQVEPRVVSVESKRTTKTGRLEYETKWADGDLTWEPAKSYMDLDGTFNIKWLEKAKEVDIRDALADLTQAELIAICDARSWKVAHFPLNFSLIHLNIHYF